MFTVLFCRPEVSEEYETLKQKYREKTPLLVPGFHTAESKSCSVHPLLCQCIFLYDPYSYLYVALQQRKDAQKPSYGKHWYKINEQFHNQPEMYKPPVGNGLNLYFVIKKALVDAVADIDAQVQTNG